MVINLFHNYFRIYQSEPKAKNEANLPTSESTSHYLGITLCRQLTHIFVTASPNASVELFIWLNKSKLESESVSRERVLSQKTEIFGGESEPSVAICTTKTPCIERTEPMQNKEVGGSDTTSRPIFSLGCFMLFALIQFCDACSGCLLVAVVLLLPRTGAVRLEF